MTINTIANDKLNNSLPLSFSMFKLSPSPSSSLMLSSKFDGYIAAADYTGLSPSIVGVRVSRAAWREWRRESLSNWSVESFSFTFDGCQRNIDLLVWCQIHDMDHFFCRRAEGRQDAKGILCRVLNGREPLHGWRRPDVWRVVFSWGWLLAPLSSSPSAKPSIICCLLHCSEFRFNQGCKCIGKPSSVVSISAVDSHSRLRKLSAPDIVSQFQALSV